MSVGSSFGQWLKQRRKSLGLTQSELALRVGCSTELMQKIETGGRRPSKQIARLLAEQLHIPPDEHADLHFLRGPRPSYLLSPQTRRGAHGAIAPPIFSFRPHF